MRIIGMMSGTSIDGIDVVIVDIDSIDSADSSTPSKQAAVDRLSTREALTGEQKLRIEQRFFTTLPWEHSVREQLFATFQSPTTAAALCQMNFVVAEHFAQAARTAMAAAQLDWQSIDLIASHGQTIWHHVVDGTVTSTLQIGDPSVIAARTGITTVGNFRTADVAVGGQGAPLVSLYDWLLLRPAADITGWRAVQNIGGIGNVTFLPPNNRNEPPFAFDTGPGNVFIDWAAVAATAGSQQYDVDGQLAAAGTVAESLVAEWLRLPYFSQSPPKTTGRELFQDSLVQQWADVAAQQGLRPVDFVATITELTAASIADAYARFAPGPITEVVVAGGGARNPILMERLRAQLSRRLPNAITLSTHQDLGVDDKAKEAIAFAFMAYRALHGQAGNVPSCTGATKAQILGQIAPGDNFRTLMQKLYATTG